MLLIKARRSYVASLNIVQGQIKDSFVCFHAYSISLNSLNMDYLRPEATLVIKQSFLFICRCFPSLMFSCVLDPKRRGENRAWVRTNVRKTVFTCYLHDHNKTFGSVTLYASAGLILWQNLNSFFTSAA